MPRHGGKHVVLVKGAEEAMRAFKQEVAGDLGLLEKMGPEMSYKKLSTVEVGNIGGEMVRRIQAAGEYAVLQRFKEGQKRLMPEEVLPAPETVRNVSNNGNLVDESGAIMDMDMSEITHLITKGKIAKESENQYTKARMVNNSSNVVADVKSSPGTDADGRLLQ